MANIAAVLKEEIARIARKELRNENDGLKQASARYRAEIAALKRRVADLEHKLSQLARSAARQSAAPAAADAEATARVRFSPKGLRTQRDRLGLSAADMGRLLGVSGQTIYNWEAGSTRPRQEQLAAIAAVRGMGKRAVQARLAEAAS